MLTKVASHFPNAEVTEIPEAAHLVLEDAPEKTNVLISDFLRETSSSPSTQASVESQNTLAVSPLFDSFLENCKNAPDRDALVEPLQAVRTISYRRMSYSDLKKLVSQYQRGMRSLGLSPGDRVVMLVKPGREFLALTYAVLGLGAVPAFVDPGIGRDKMFECIKKLNASALIGMPRAQLLRLKKEALFPGLKFSISVGHLPVPGAKSLAYLEKFSDKEVPAVPNFGSSLVAFTSGATGTPKGVVYSNKMLKKQLQVMRDSFGLQAGGVDVPILPVFALFHLALGVSSVFPPLDPSKPLDLDPELVLKVMRDEKATSSFGSPTIWKKILDYAKRQNQALPQMRRIFMAGAAVPLDVIESVPRVAPGAEVFTPYGATEALPVTLVSGKEIKQNKPLRSLSGELGHYVGKPVDGIEIRIAAPKPNAVMELTDAEALKAGEIGEVLVRGDNVSPEYLFAEEATTKSKVQEAHSFWHRMGDVGYLDENGGLYFCGRLVHSVKTAKRVFYSVPSEMVFNSLPGVKRSALVGVPGPSGLPSVAMVVEPHLDSFPRDNESISTFISKLKIRAAEDVSSQGIEEFYFHPSFPVDPRHNAKIYRDQLTNWVLRMKRLKRAA
jgi:acyl-CoA synthetase (AMP-forming)/AMP-acid ligase II